MGQDGRAGFAEQVAALREQAGLSLAEVAAAAHVARGHVHNIEHGRRWPSQGVAKALDNALGAGGALLATWEVADASPKAATVPVGPENRERVALVARHPQRVDVATVGALAGVLAATRRLEDRVGSAAVLPGVRANLTLVRSLLADACGSVRDGVGVLAAELHQCLGWLLAQTGHPEQAQRELDAALALGVEFDDPDLASLVLSLKAHLAWELDDPHGVIALSRAASRDQRVSIAQRAENAYYEARGWAMVGEPAEVHRILRHADELAERAVARQADAPPYLYWCGAGYFTLQRGSAWHTLGDPRVAQRAATDMITGLRDMPEAERDSEWATIYNVRAAEAFTTAGEAELAFAHARQALVVCHATRSTRLAGALQRAHTQMRDHLAHPCGRARTGRRTAQLCDGRVVARSAGVSEEYRAVRSVRGS